MPKRTYHEYKHEFAVSVAHLARVHDLVPSADLEDVGEQAHVIFQLLARQQRLA
jgi:hypothetical protein